MSWTTPNDLKARLDQLWERGELLRKKIVGETLFPLQLSLKGPATRDLTHHFEAVRTWIVELTSAPHFRIQWREVKHRVHGTQRLPQSIWIDALGDALEIIGKRRDFERFVQVEDMTRNTLPALLPWLGRRPLEAIELDSQWTNLLGVTKWLINHPRPAIYLRQVDVPGVHSKFIEAHRAILSELFDLVLPAGTIEAERTGVGQFAARYGFLEKPVRIRFRILDERINAVPGVTKPDITLDAASFSDLDIPLRRVFITENETNFLAFPAAEFSIVIFGAGYGWDALARARWLTQCEIYYWGDVDTHGFAILDQLRNRFAHVSSFLMDQETLMAHKAHWGDEADQVLHDLPRLNVKERALFDTLRDNRIRKNLRLEQERISFQWVTERLLLIVGDRVGDID